MHWDEISCIGECYVNTGLQRKTVCYSSFIANSEKCLEIRLRVRFPSGAQKHFSEFPIKLE